MVQLLPGNKDLAEIYLTVRTQVIVGPAGIVDIDQKAVLSVLNLFEVGNKKEMFIRLLGCFRLETELTKHKDAEEQSQ